MLSKRSRLCVAMCAAIGGIGIFAALVLPNFLLKTALPRTMPSNFTLLWRSGGGALQYGERVTLRGTDGLAEAWSTETAPSKKEQSTFVLSEEKAEEIYQFLRSHRADQMEVVNAAPFDGDNSGYDISWDDSNVYIWGMAVETDDRQRFSEIYQYLSEQFAQYLPTL